MLDLGGYNVKTNVHAAEVLIHGSVGEAALI
jgi:hypothetical protein